MTRLTFNVLDECSSPVGRLKMAICDTYDEFDSHFAFSKLACGFEHFARQLPTEDIYPIATFDDLQIHADKQHQGFGRLGIRAFAVVASRHRAKLGVLRIGTQGDSYCTGLAWRRRLYQSEGWKSFRRPRIRGLVLHWMYYLLDTTALPDRDISTILSEVDEDADFFHLFRNVKSSA